MRYRLLKGYKYQLVQGVTIHTKVMDCSAETDYLFLEPDGRLTISQGYAWDGCSGPTWDDRTNMRGGLAHDGLYQLMRIGVIPLDCREQADQTLYDLCIQDGMNKIRAGIYFKAVRMFGAKHAKPRCEECEIFEA